MTRAGAAVIVCAALVAAAPGASAQRARRSVECGGCIGNWYYLDENAAAGATRDWNCGSSTYDGHRGSDWSLTGGLAAIDTGYNVTAIADGTVVGINDGAYDRCTMCGGAMCGTSFGFGYGNYVRIDHGTRSVIYAHMRRGSLRVGMGARVTCGQVIGQIASSGCSTGAHLHTEFRTVGGSSTTAYDPYQGSCSPTSPSVWTMQSAYRTLPADTCDGMPPPPTCPSGTFSIWTCNAAATARVRCISGMVMTEICPYGCEGRPVGTDDVCRPPPACTGTSEWACNADRSGRRRCNAGTEQTEACAMGCRVVDPGDDVCNTTPVCPSGVGAAWACTADRMSRQRCVMGRVETEACGSGCVPAMPDATCAAGMAGDSGGSGDAGSGDAGSGLDGGVLARDGGRGGGDARSDGGGGRARPAIMAGCGCRVPLASRGGGRAGGCGAAWVLAFVASRWVRRRRGQDRPRSPMPPSCESAPGRAG